MFQMFQLDFITQAFMVSVIVGIVLSYLGVHVVGRGIVFVDLALGQISMLGVAFAGFIEKDPTLVSVIFTMAGAFLPPFLHIRDQPFKKDAVDGTNHSVPFAAAGLI